MKRKLALISLLSLFWGVFAIPFAFTSSAAEYTQDIECKSAVLMDAATGKILYEKNADEALAPASVTKIMTLLLIMEALDAGKIGLSDPVTASERAAEMGGSQIFMKVGESLSVEDLIKSIVIASANDATVAMAEHIAGSESEFVAMMNTRAAELGMKNTSFENTNGLDDTAEHHLTSASDIALMSKELLSHEKILDYTSIWMDSIRNGEFVLTNTNRLIRFYPGATGLKTGSTAKAGFCISATAMRNGMHLIAVVMGAPSRDTRNEIAKSLLDFGFANYALYRYDGGEVATVPVTGGTVSQIGVSSAPFAAIVPKGTQDKIEVKLSLPERISAPIPEGAVLGSIEFIQGENVIGSGNLTAKTAAEEISFFEYFWRLFRCFVTFKNDF